MTTVRIRLDRGLLAWALTAAWAALYAGGWLYWREHLHRADRPFWAALPVALAVGLLLLTVRRELFVNRYGVTFTRWPAPARHRPRLDWRLVAVTKREERYPRRIVWEVVGGTDGGPVRLSRPYRSNARAEALAARIREALGPPPRLS